MLYNLKEVAKRCSAFAGAVGLVSALALTMLPSASFADALNPLTDRSLTLSSSSPGWSFTDGSGNPTYAAPGTGPNGQKTGETFNFRVSTDSSDSVNDPTIKAFTFQYCTTPAGTCISPGNGAYSASTSNLNVNYADTAVDGTDFKVYYALNATDKTNGTPYTTADTTNVQESTGWTIHAAQWYTTGQGAPGQTTENNYFSLVNTDGGINLPSGAQIWIELLASNDNYVTNPGGVEEPFFVRMNDYKSATNLLSSSNTDDSDVIDGGVTVANVMNQSIHITTKVLETMTFSVGTSNPDLNTALTESQHGPCDTLWHTPSDQTPGTADLTDQQSADWDLIKLGNPTTEYSLSPTTAYDANSWWRLSTNSSAGATVYYSGETLTNTEGDWITAIGEDKLAETNAQSTPVAIDNSADGFTDWNEPKASHPGSEQFGLALDQRTITPQAGVGNSDSLAPLVATPAYADGGAGDAAITLNGGAKFAFDRNSLTTPVPLASESDKVINCSTGKIRYLANIEAATPAGVYTTKINYIAAPQY